MFKRFGSRWRAAAGVSAAIVVVLAALSGSADRAAAVDLIPTKLVVAVPGSAVAGGPAQSITATLTIEATGDPVVGQLVTVSAGSAAIPVSCTASTDAQGQVSCAATWATSGTKTVTAGFIANAGLAASTDSDSVLVSPAETELQSPSASPSPATSTMDVQLFATFTRTSAPAGPISNALVTFTLKDSNNIVLRSCSGVTISTTGLAGCVLQVPGEAVGPSTVTVSAAGTPALAAPTPVVFPLQVLLIGVGNLTAPAFAGVVGVPQTITPTLTNAVTGQPLAGREVTFTLPGGDACQSSTLTDVNGRATCTVTPTAAIDDQYKVSIRHEIGVLLAAERFGEYHVGAPDPTATTVSDVTSSTPDGTSGVGFTVAVRVVFSEPVSVTGTPLLALNSGAGAMAVYSSGSGTNTLHFNYVVAAGQNTPDLDYISTTSLTTNGGTIKDADNNAADLTLPTPGALGSLGGNKDITIDTTVPCSAGSYSDSGNEPCTPAPAGSFAAGTGNTFASLCPPGTFTDTPGRANCTNAPAGSSASGNGNTSSSLCPAGTYTATPGEADCSNAPAGSFADGLGNTTATPCPPGTFTGTAGQSSCTNAPAGSHVTGSGNTSASPCPPGTFTATAGQADCSNAPAGSFADGDGNTSATPCLPGTFSATGGQANCTDAPAGSHATGNGNIAASPCPPGTFTATAGQANCTDAPAGSHASGGGNTSSSLCPPGTFTASTGQANCTSAPAGSFASGSGNTSATQCAPGTFASTAGQTSCTNAPAGSFATGSGNTSATQCLPGTYSASAGQSSCTSAPAGSFASGSGNTSATPCEPGTFTATAGHATCTAAAIGFYVPTQGQDHQTACPAGTSTKSTGSTSVAACVGVLTTKRQAMGDLKVAQGSILSVGYSFSMPGKHPAATVSFLQTTVTFNATCASGTPESQTIVVTASSGPYTVAANSGAWVPSDKPDAAATYQGSTTVPSFCDPGALVRFKEGGTFSTLVTSTDTTDEVKVRWHYMDGKGGAWSSEYKVIPS